MTLGARGFGHLGAAIGLVAGLTGCVLSSDDPALPPASSAAVVDSDGVRPGIAVPRSRSATVQAVEEDIGETFDVVRVFRRWDDRMPDPELAALVESGHRIHLSVRPMRADGAAIAWADLASAEDGEPLYEELVAWLSAVAAMPEGSYFTVSHEPETKEGALNGTASDFKMMWRRVHDLLNEMDADHVALTWTMTGGAFSDDRAELWYPGDDVVDVIGTDSYNWFTCQGGERPWYELEQLLFQPLAFARSHAKPLVIPEFASAEDPADPERRATWMRNAAEFLERPEVAADIEFAAWFNVTAPGGTYPNCVWDYDTTPESAQAFAELMGTLGH